MLDAAVAAIRGGVNQYPPPLGDPVLRHAIAEHQRRFYGLEHDPDTEVLVTAGATEALAGALLGMLDAGDEVVLFEPMYDSYQACIALAGARPVPVLLRPGDDGRYHYDPAELRAAVSPRTKLILLNTPHNPTGKVFDAAELADIAALAIEHDLIVVADEVYEHLVFPGARHVPLATLPGMAERTLTISSGGKTFNTTGWKIGWLCGPPALVTAAKTAKQFLTYVSGAPFQPAIAAGLHLGDDYFAGHRRSTSPPSATDSSTGCGRPGSRRSCPRRRTSRRSTSARSNPTATGWRSAARCPPAAAWSASPTRCSTPAREHGRHLVRFACCKRFDVLDEAATRLATLA